MSVRTIQKQYRLAFTGYHEFEVKTAVETIMNKAESCGIVVNSNPKKEKGQIHYQPKLRGCDKKDLHVYSLTISGDLANAKDLVREETPLGVQIDLLPKSM